MAKRSPQSEDPALLLKKFHKLLQNFDQFLNEEDDVRKRVQKFVPLSSHLRHVGLSIAVQWQSCTRSNFALSSTISQASGRGRRTCSCWWDF